MTHAATDNRDRLATANRDVGAVIRRALFGLAAVAALGAGLLSVAAWRALQLEPQPTIQTFDDRLPLDERGVAAKLAETIRFKTVADTDGISAEQAGAFSGLHEALIRQFPKVHATLSREVIAGASLLYTWKGADESLPPVILTSHLDVVPAAIETSSGKWTYPPFDGVVADGHVWGRGAIDDKFGVVCIFEAIETLVATGFKPKRTLYLAFGHDEEVAGLRGAKTIAETLKARGLAPAFVLDEGGYVTLDVFRSIPRPIAVVAIAEKGAIVAELRVRNMGPVHSSSPAEDDPVEILARAIVAMGDTPFSTRLAAPVRTFLEHLAHEQPMLERIATANLWLFEPLVRYGLTREPATNALARTTAVATVLHGSLKENAIPEVATATVSVRILQGDTVASVLDQMRVAIADDRVEIKVLRSREPSPTAPIETKGFAIIKAAIQDVFDRSAVVPVLQTGGTDARHYAILTPNIYRFAPVAAPLAQLSRVHGIDERVSTKAIGDGVRFYRRLIARIQEM